MLHLRRFRNVLFAYAQSLSAVSLFYNHSNTIFSSSLLTTSRIPTILLLCEHSDTVSQRKLAACVCRILLVSFLHCCRFPLCKKDEMWVSMGSDFLFYMVCMGSSPSFSFIPGLYEESISIVFPSPSFFCPIFAVLSLLSAKHELFPGIDV